MSYLTNIKKTEFDNFLLQLKYALNNRKPRTIQQSDLKPASVLIPLVYHNNNVYVLLTKRTNKVGTHKGEVSFPGGSIDATDTTPLDAAIRETNEEIGINHDEINIIGEFDNFVSIYGFLVYTFVATIDYHDNFNFNKNEIESIFYAPLDLFIEEKYDKVDYYNYKDKNYAIYYYNYDGYVIWGLTARILTDFSRKILKPILKINV